MRAARPVRRAFAFPVLTGAAALAAALLLVWRGGGQPAPLVRHLPPATNEIASAGVIEVLDAAPGRIRAGGGGCAQGSAEGARPVDQRRRSPRWSRLGGGDARASWHRRRTRPDPEARLRAVDSYAD
jgi:hypothetical protein